MCDAIPPDDAPLFEGWRRARKEHRCCACRDTVHAGERYHVTTGIWDSEFASYKQCARCRLIWERLQFVMLPDECIPFELNCGEVYDGDDESFIALAFLTRDEAQERACG